MQVRLHSGWVEKLALSKEAGGLLSSSVDGTLALHTLSVHGELRLRHTLKSPANKVRGMADHCRRGHC